MAERIRVRLNHAAIAEMLRVQFAPAVHEAAVKIAESTRVELDRLGYGDMREDVATYVTDRAHPVVAIAHPAGQGVEHKHGVLTRAAAEHGFEVHGG